ncbi:WD40-repeat-containing domain [Pseudocohnilembus persalinus]|uniref:WD40-repeat-containing domain n=1 Tax=Pseudocohnilembus persalinus TaxID=266149 RepID=A0A0V0QBI7_PSEPJ|nr:WD40-repeat-containing domain [Pseudocohnilembus persalinus]|eukprot:KRW99612.1 WD40-repeat-containing domain [Pseudocohnilembus persalinus]
MAEQDNQVEPELQYVGSLEGHSGWVTCIASGFSKNDNEDSNVLVSGSRDKSLIIWKFHEQTTEDGQYGYALRSLTGHSHFVSDLALSQENSYAVSSSWDKTLRLWDLRAGKTSRKFQGGHSKEVFSVAFSPDNRQIISAGADRKIVLWNTLAQLKYESQEMNHSDWVSCVRYAPGNKSTKGDSNPYFATVGWDGRLKIWNTNIQVKYTFKAHESNANGVSISPNGRYIATGGKDRKLLIWDIKDLRTASREFDAGSTIFQIAFNPKLQWVAAGTEQGVKIWDLMSANTKPIATLQAEQVVTETKEGTLKRQKLPMCVSLTWNALGRKIFAGFTDALIRVWQVNEEYQGAKN